MSNSNTTIPQNFDQAVQSIQTHELGAIQKIAQIVKQFNIQANSSDDRAQVIKNLINEAAKHHVRRHNVLFGENGEKVKQKETVQSLMQSRISPTNNTVNKAVNFQARPITDSVKKEEPKKPELPSAEHAGRLERVREMVTDLENLNKTINSLQTRATSLVASTPTDAPAEAVKLWESAISKIKSSLNRLIKISDDQNPTSLLNTKHKLENMVALFEENAAGAEGIGLQEDEERLKNFESRLSSIDPEPNMLTKSLQSTLVDQTLTVDFLQNKTDQILKSYEANHARVSKINHQMQELKGGTLNRVRSSKQGLQKLKVELEKVLQNSELDKDLIEKGKKWMILIDQVLEKFPTEANVDNLVEWAEKFKSDQTFTALKFRNRIKKDLMRPLVAAERATGLQKSRYNPQSLIDEANKRRLTSLNSLKIRVGKTANQARRLYQDLIGLRRSKMGESFDERFSGQVAQDVSSLIEDIADFEVRLIKFSGELGGIQKVTDKFTSKATEFTSELSVLKKRSKPFLESSKLEELLGGQLVAILAPLKEKIGDITIATNQLAEAKNYLQSLPATDQYIAGLQTVIESGEALQKAIQSFVGSIQNKQAKSGFKSEIDKIISQIDSFAQKSKALSSKELFLEKLIRKFADDVEAGESQVKNIEQNLVMQKQNFENQIAQIKSAQEVEVKNLESQIISAHQDHSNFAASISEKMENLQNKINQKLASEQQASKDKLIKLSNEFSRIDQDLSAIYENSLTKKLEVALEKLNTWIKSETKELDELTTQKITLSASEIKDWLDSLEKRKEKKEFVESKYYILKNALSSKSFKDDTEFTSAFAEINQKVDSLDLPEKIEVQLPFDKAKVDAFKETLTHS